MLGFKVTRIWPFNPKVMNAKTRSANIYITMNSNHEAEGEGHYTLDDKVGPNQQEEQETMAIEFFNMVSIIINQTRNATKRSASTNIMWKCLVVLQQIMLNMKNM